MIRAINRILPSDTSGEQYRKLFPRFLEKTNNIPDANVLEIGSRNEAGQVQKGRFTSAKEYVGFDYYPGDNVDVVGDAHKLSRYLPQEHFDAVYSNSVFEHLAMPWKVVLEMNKVMKTGGLVFINTHPAYPPHNRPWDFWRFQESSFSTLLNAKTGFRIIDCEIWGAGLSRFIRQGNVQGAPQPFQAPCKPWHMRYRRKNRAAGRGPLMGRRC